MCTHTLLFPNRRTRGTHPAFFVLFSTASVVAADASKTDVLTAAAAAAAAAVTASASCGRLSARHSVQRQWVGCHSERREREVEKKREEREREKFSAEGKTRCESHERQQECHLKQNQSHVSRFRKQEEGLPITLAASATEATEAAAGNREKTLPRVPRIDGKRLRALPFSSPPAPFEGSLVMRHVRERERQTETR